MVFCEVVAAFLTPIWSVPCRLFPPLWPTAAEFLEPIKTFRRQLFERLKNETPNLRALLVTYLAIEGLRSLNLFDFDILSPEERDLLLSSLLEIAEKG